VSFNITSY